MDPLPIKDRLPFLYVEHGGVRTRGAAVVVEASGQEADVPITRLACLLLGPGTSVTHAAMKALAGAGVLVQWVGEGVTRVYAAGEPLTGHPERLKAQVAVAFNTKWRTKAVAWMFSRRFGEKVSSDVDEASLRGMEGARIRALYQRLAEQHGVRWEGRRTGSRPGEWGALDPLNRAISVANGALIQAATAAVLVAGYSPAIGFMHSGFDRAFACDIADLHKFSVTVPLAFRLHAEGRADQRTVRHATRDEIVRLKLVDQMVKDAVEVVDASLRRS